MPGASRNTSNKILFAVQNFRQGWGGAPESVRLMARALSTEGILSDVYDSGGLVSDVGALSSLPDQGIRRVKFDLTTTGDYAAILQTGPWQSPTGLWRLRRTRKNARWIYLPRGGLGQAEFENARDFKKRPYLAVVERSFITGSEHIVFSSEAERALTLSWSFPSERALVIPDFVAPRASLTSVSDEFRSPVVTFAFLAEISPRKGLHLLVDAFIAWVRDRGLVERVRLKVGGAPRPGSTAYWNTIRNRASFAAQSGIKIDFIGPVAHTDRENFYRTTDVMVIASSFESFGLTIFEAMGEGCVVLSTPDVGALEQTGKSSGVIALPSATIDAMVKGFDQTMTALSTTNRSSRAADAAQAIGKTNRIALLMWRKTLGVEQLQISTTGHSDFEGAV